MTQDDIRFVNELYAVTPSGEGRVGMQRAFCAGLARGKEREAAAFAQRDDDARDARRLNWIERERADIGYYQGGLIEIEFSRRAPSGHGNQQIFGGKHKTLRAAIDSAMEEGNHDPI